MLQGRGLLGRPTRFEYHKDRYGLQLLRYALGDSVDLGEVRKSRFGTLLQKRRMQPLLAVARGRRLDLARLPAAWRPTPLFEYDLTIGLSGTRREDWGEQMSRPGINLVLQVNFTEGHDAPYRALVQPDPEEPPFVRLAHPVRTDRNTLAWARIDVDLGNGEALVEEIQSDWVKRAQWARAESEPCERCGHVHWTYCGARGGPDATRRYVDEVLGEHAKLWGEATLAAALWLLVEELGLRRVFYHTLQSGRVMKRMRYEQPPRSLYTELPRQFCFRETPEPPSFLRRRRRLRERLERNPDLRFYELSFDGAGR